MLPTQLLQQLQTELELQIYSHQSVAGGDIARAFRMKSDKGDFFLKYLPDGADVFEAEAQGLRLLGSAKSDFVLPKVVALGRKPSFLLLEWVDMGRPSTVEASYAAGKALAQLHLNESENGMYGLDYDNYIGSLRQENGWYGCWEDFYYEKRGHTLLKKGVERGLFESSILKHFDAFFADYVRQLPAHPPALLHGDLWSGNYAFTPSGQPLMYDPAVYYGHPEMDLGMTQLFGGFSPDFYRGYADHNRNLDPDWRARLQMHQLWPLLVHALLFGGGYVGQVMSALRSINTSFY